MTCASTPAATVRTMAITLTPVASTDKVHISGDVRPLSAPVILFSGDVAHLWICLDTTQYFESGKLRLSGGAAARAIKPYRVGYVPSVFDCPPDVDDYYDVRPEKIYPDVLEPVDLSRIQGQVGCRQAYFFQIKDSDKIPVGDHVITVRCYVGDKQAAKCSFTLRKLSAVLPKQKAFSTCWMHYDSIEAQHNVKMFSRDFYKVFGSYLDAAVYSGQTMLLLPVITPAFDTEVGTERRTAQLLDIREDAEGNFTFDFTKMHAFIDFALAHGIEQFEMPPMFTQWGALHCPKVMVKGADGRTRLRFGWKTDSLSDDYRRFLATLIPALVSEMRARGLEEKTFFHVSDEPHKDQLERWQACKNMITPYLGNCRTLDACSDIEFAGKNEREYAVAVEYKLQPFIDAGCRPLCTYFCCNPRGRRYPNRFMMQPLPRLIVLGASLWRYDIDLFLQWGFNFYNTFLSRREVSPYGNTDCDNMFLSGDGFIVYPNYAGRSANMSIRLVAMREMWRLSRILYALEEKLGRDAVLAILDNGGVTDFNVYPIEPGWLFDFQNRLAAML